MKIAVLGAGHLGRIHLDIIKRISEFDLVGFYDPDPHLSSKISEELSVRSFESMSSLIDATEIVDIVILMSNGNTDDIIKKIKNND